jgi:phosphocarrier protein HPr
VGTRVRYERRCMAERETTVGPEEGLHARPAAQFVKKAKQFSSDIVVIKGDREANAKSSLKVMTLGAKKGDSITIRAEGEDAEEAVEALADSISADEH